MAQPTPDVTYSILDPTGNITALVETPVAPADQPQLAACLMARHPEVEQVGFVRAGRTPEVHVELRMAGGEFCGNATMSAAALHAIRTRPGRAHRAEHGDDVFVLRVSGASRPVEVGLRQETEASYCAWVRMPNAVGIESVGLVHGNLADELPVVMMEGISHAIVCADSPLFGLMHNRQAAEQAVRSWCHQLHTDGLGLMFLEREGETSRLTPLVYVPGSDTVFWENSCASGTTAVGIYMSHVDDSDCDMELAEPGGPLRVQSAGLRGGTLLHGHVRLVGTYGMPRPGI